MKFYRIAWVIVRAYLKIFNRWKVEGAENVPETGAAVIIANHISYADPVIVACSVKRPVHFMAKEELFRIWGLKGLIKVLGAFPVKRGKIDRTTLRTAAKHLDEGKLLGIFPEGTRYKSGKLGEFLPGASLFALRAGVPIIPVAMKGTQRIIFNTITVRIGKPLVYPEYYGGKIGEEILTQVTKDCHEQVQMLLSETEENIA
ncbi:MAG: lysophospholipid acyltransferase family protein [Peptococcia bacterium]